MGRDTVKDNVLYLQSQSMRNNVIFTSIHEDTHELTRHNSADSVPTSNLVCITEVAIRTTLRIAGMM